MPQLTDTWTAIIIAVIGVGIATLIIILRWGKNRDGQVQRINPDGTTEWVRIENLQIGDEFRRGDFAFHVISKPEYYEDIDRYGVAASFSRKLNEPRSSHSS